MIFTYPLLYYINYTIFLKFIKINYKYNNLKNRIIILLNYNDALYYITNIKLY